MPARPENTAADAALAEITARVRAAAAARTPLRIRGGGTKDFHGAQALHGELLETRALRGIIAYEPSELVVTLRAGTALAELEALLAAQGQCLPFEPPHFALRAADSGAGASQTNDTNAHAGTATDAHSTDGASVGGMLAAGLSGPARASVGALRDYVLGVTLLNGRAELLRFGGQVMKNVAGYDVSRLMAGAWGTLGLLTEISLKVLPAAPAEATLRFDCDQQQALELLHAFGRKPLPLNASRWQQAPDAAHGDAGHLHIRLRGASAAVQAACQAMGGERVEPARAAADWAACRDQRLAWFSARPPGAALWRLSLPATTPALAWPGCAQPPLIEWHGALRWLQAPACAGPALQQAARAVGGSASLFLAAAGAAPVGSALDLQSDALRQIHQRLKNSFDPAGIFNPGRMVW